MPRPRTLSRELIIDAALRVGDREGAKAMSMRRIAGELDCDPMALYRHFDDRTALLDEVADRALAGVADPDPRKPWADRITDVMRGIRAAALAHPGIAPHVASRPPMATNGKRLGVAVFAALAEAGLAPPEVVRAAQTLVAYVAAALAMAVNAGARDARWHQLSTTLSALPGGPPGRDLFVVGSEDQFDYGLRLLVAGIRAEATKTRSESPRS